MEKPNPPSTNIVQVVKEFSANLTNLWNTYNTAKSKGVGPKGETLQDIRDKVAELKILHVPSVWAFLKEWETRTEDYYVYLRDEVFYNELLPMSLNGEEKSKKPTQAQLKHNAKNDNRVIEAYHSKVKTKKMVDMMYSLIQGLNSLDNTIASRLK